MSSIATLSARAIARTSAFKTSKSRANARRPARHIARASADVDEALAKAQCPIADVKDTIGRGFVIVDIRSPEEWQEGSKSTWKKICLAVFDEETGEVEMQELLALPLPPLPLGPEHLLGEEAAETLPVAAGALSNARTAKELQTALTKNGEGTEGTSDRVR